MKYDHTGHFMIAAGGSIAGVMLLTIEHGLNRISLSLAFISASLIVVGVIKDLRQLH